MERLPNEVLSNILSRLKFEDKRQCNLVSQGWHQRVQRNVLYQTLVFKNTDQLCKAVEFFKEKPFKTLVNRIDMSLCELPISDFVKLPFVFPRLKYLNIADFDPKFKTPRRSLELEAAIMQMFEKSMQQWGFLREIVEKTGSYPVVVSFLKAPRPVYLTSINITYNKRHGFIGNYRNNFRLLITLTKNAPFLEQFCARFTFVSLIDFEELHRNCPKLHTISITASACDKTVPDLNKWFQDEADLNHFIPYHTANMTGVLVNTPATSLKRLKIKITRSFMSIGETELTNHIIRNWLRYIQFKYPDLSSFEFFKITNELQRAQESEMHLIQQDIKSTLSNLGNLENLNCNMVPFTNTVVQSISSGTVKLSRCTLHSFKFYSLERQINNMAALMTNKDQLKELQCISNKHSAEHVPTRFNVLNHFCNLTQLTLISEIENAKVQVSNVLEHAPNIDFLALSGFCPVVRTSQAKQRLMPTRLKTLQIRKFGFIKLKDWFNLNKALKYDILPNCTLLTRFDFSTARFNYSSYILWDDMPFLLELDFQNNRHLQRVNINLLASKRYRINGQQKHITCCPSTPCPLLPEYMSEYPVCTLIERLPDSVAMNQDVIQ